MVRCACCPPNIARTLSSLGEYLFMQNDDGLFINMFAGGEYKTTALGGYKRLNIETKFPFEGKITISNPILLTRAQRTMRLQTKKYM